MAKKYVNLTLFYRPTGQKKGSRDVDRQKYGTRSSLQKRKHRSAQSILLYVKLGINDKYDTSYISVKEGIFRYVW